MKHTGWILILAVTLTGCMQASVNPSAPTLPGTTRMEADSLASQIDNPGPHRLWGEWTFFFNAERDRVDVVPRRQARFHLNALKFLEEYCADCLEITGIEDNGDDTVDLTIRMTHPFQGYPEYTGFDVKGIIMFTGSTEFPYSLEKPLPDPCRLSFREAGDPEVLEPDGYTYRWSPNYDSGSDQPIFNYWEGKYSSGIPNADLNAFMNFYNIEERHIFTTNAEVSRTYTIWLPPGQPVVAGYAFEACWEPPTKTPVTNPIEDFPPSANQSEPYVWKVILPEGEVIADCADFWGGGGYCGNFYCEIKSWSGFQVGDGEPHIYHISNNDHDLLGLVECDSPPYEDAYSWEGGICDPEHTNGIYRALVVYRISGTSPKIRVYTIVRYIIDE